MVEKEINQAFGGRVHSVGKSLIISNTSYIGSVANNYRCILLQE